MLRFDVSLQQHALMLGADSDVRMTFVTGNWHSEPLLMPTSSTPLYIANPA